MKEQLVVEACAAEARVQLVEMGAAEGQLIGKDIRQCYDLRGGAVGERSSDGGASVAASQQAETHGRVGLVAEGGARLQ